MNYLVAPRNATENFSLSPDGSMIYVASDDGHLRIYDSSSGSLLQDYWIGNDLDGITISRDGRYAIITEEVPISTQQSNNWTSNVTVSAVYQVDLRTGLYQTYTFQGQGEKYTFADVAYADDDTVLLSMNILPGWSGWAPLYTLELGTGAFTPHGSYYSGLGTTASLTQAINPGNVLLGQLGLSSADYFVIDPSGTSVASSGTYANGVYGYAGGIEAFTGTGASGRVAIVTGGAMHLYDGNMGYLLNLSTYFPYLADSPGMTFSPDGSVLYAIDPVNDRIIGIAMDDYFIAETIPLGNLDYTVLKFGEELILSPDGASFLIATTTGIVHVDRPTTGIRTNGDDVITGTASNDELSGGQGNDLIFGLSGNDLISGGSGADSMLGGTGDDDYLVDTQGDIVVEMAGEGIDLVYSSTSYYLYDNVELLVLESAAGAAYGVGTADANGIAGNEWSNLLIGMGGDDQLLGGGGDDLLFGGEGQDTLNGEGGIDYIVGGAGDDLIDGGIAADALYGEDGNDTLSGGNTFHTDIMVGGAGNDTIYGDSGSGDYDLMYGNTGDDTFYVDTPADLVFEQSGEGTDTVYAGITGAGYYLYDNIENLVLIGQTPFGVGNALDNSITGNNFSNWLLGGLGNDTLVGKGGNDVLFGEGGADTFEFGATSGQDVIADFQIGIDKIKLIGLHSDFATASLNFVQNGSDGALRLSTGHFIVLQNVTMANLTANDFIFG